MNVKVRMKIGLESQAYAAPRAESIELINEGLLCASVIVSGVENEDFEEVIDGAWGEN